MYSWLVVAGHSVGRHWDIVEFDASGSANGVLDPGAGDTQADAGAVATKLCTAGIECEGMWDIAKDVPNRRVRAGSRNGVSQRRDPIKARRERIAKSQAREDTVALRTQSLQENRPTITAAVHCRR